MAPIHGGVVTDPNFSASKSRFSGLGLNSEADVTELASSIHAIDFVLVHTRRYGESQTTVSLSSTNFYCFYFHHFSSGRKATIWVAMCRGRIQDFCRRGCTTKKQRD